MIENFKEWMIEIQDEAIKEKCRKAKEKGDETKWENEIWKSPEKTKL